MDFWTTFYKESLQNPWRIGLTHGALEAVSIEPEQPWIFVEPPSLAPELHEMVEKMMAALKLSKKKATVHVSETGEELSEWSQQKRVVFFGNHYPGSMGLITHWSGHQILKTHSLADLAAKPTLKKETWHQLQQLAGLR